MTNSDENFNNYNNDSHFDFGKTDNVGSTQATPPTSEPQNAFSPNNSWNQSGTPQYGQSNVPQGYYNNQQLMNNSMSVIPVWVTILVTLLFGVFGAIPAYFGEEQAKQAGLPKNKHWKAFWITMIASVLFAILIFFMVLAPFFLLAGVDGTTNYNLNYDLINIAIR